jgi:hypothetical protein
MSSLTRPMLRDGRERLLLAAHSGVHIGTGLNTVRQPVKRAYRAV